MSQNSAIQFQPMVIPTTPTQANRSLFGPDPITGTTPSSSFDNRPGAKFRGASVEVSVPPPCLSLGFFTQIHHVTSTSNAYNHLIPIQLFPSLRLLPLHVDDWLACRIHSNMTPYSTLFATLA